MATVSASIDEARLEAFVSPFYAPKDEMHGVAHVRRIYKEARALAQSYPDADLCVIMGGAYLHGIVFEAADQARAFFRDQGLAHATVEAMIMAARESLKEREGGDATTLEGKILHDAHLLEGGKTFWLVKSLVVGALRRMSLDETVRYMETHHVPGRFPCYLPEAQARYAEKEAFVWDALADLRAHL